jgi:hypothetical protein
MTQKAESVPIGDQDTVFPRSTFAPSPISHVELPTLMLTA